MRTMHDSERIKAPIHEEQRTWFSKVYREVWKESFQKDLPQDIEGWYRYVLYLQMYPLTPEVLNKFFIFCAEKKLFMPSDQDECTVGFNSLIAIASIWNLCGLMGGYHSAECFIITNFVLMNPLISKPWGLGRKDALIFQGSYAPELILQMLRKSHHRAPKLLADIDATDYSTELLIEQVNYTVNGHYGHWQRNLNW